MRHVPTLLRRELGAYFLGPMAFLSCSAFQVIAWLNFWELVDMLSQPQREFSSLRDPMNIYISGSTPFWIALLVAVPALTMRLLAEERRSGTIEPLLTVPVTETEIVLAKWLAGVVMYLVLLVPVRHLPAVPLLPGEVPFRPGPARRPGHRPDDDGHDVRGDRPVLQRADPEPDRRGDLDVRGAVPAGGPDPAHVLLRGPPASGMGRGRPLRVGSLPDPEPRPRASSTSGRSRSTFRCASSCSFSP